VDNTVIRDIQAPTEPEARAMAAPVVDAFLDAGWTLHEELWIPGDRRPGLGETLLLSTESQMLLEGEGTLHLMFANADPQAVAPTVEPATRTPDFAEDLGGVRYRRLVPRWGVGLVIGIPVLLLFVFVMSGIPGSPFGPAPTPDGGVCPVGWVPGMHATSGGGLEPDGTCQQVHLGP
jgi:hypothetical protein